MSNSNFWDDFIKDGYVKASSMDEFLENGHNQVLKVAKRVESEVTALNIGDRVAFIESLQNILTYDKVPDRGILGTIIKIKSASSLGGRVAIRWDSNELIPMLPTHLKKVGTDKVGNFSFMVSSLMDITSSFSTIGMDMSNELIHISSGDIWNYKQSDDGSGFVVERVFGEDGKPLRVNNG